MKLDFADVKPSLISLLIVGTMAVVFISFAKFILNRYQVPGLTEVINSV